MHVALIGFPGAGKSTVGRLAAAQLGMAFVDLDDAIAAQAGEPVPALVARDVDAFRQLEGRVLRQVLAGPPVVLATGGGCPCWGDNHEVLRAQALVLWLEVSPGSAVARTQLPGSSVRPLLGDVAHATQLLAQRRARYAAAAHAAIATEARGLAAVVEDVVGLVAALGKAPPPSCAVALGHRSYGVTIVDDWAPDLFTTLAGPRYAVVVDEHVAAAWRGALVRAGLGHALAVVEVPSGEASKSLAEYGRLCDALLAARVDRATTLVAIGGGVVGDLAGFVAATLLRGLRVVHLPTTLLAMVDSAIGGKTGIDMAAGKNVVGAFWQPQRVYAIAATLGTLPERERRAAFGELWKYALLDGETLWDTVAQAVPWVDTGGPPTPAVRTAIAQCMAYKARVIGADERERPGGPRMLLNLGHTVGHAIESASNYQLHHGECVGLGLVAACHVSGALGLAPPALATRVVLALRRSGLPCQLGPLLDEATLALLGSDKKRIAADVQYVTVSDVGNCGTAQISLADLRAILRKAAAVC